ncbi:MAG: 50S ribosomal protein L17 [Candidatus Paceibacterota bacterium]|jgi:large subunit ribosomal protein L17
MHHHNKNRKFGLENDARRALMRSLAEALASKGVMTTTDAKARELRPYFERLLTIGKRDTDAARRLLTKRLGTKARAELVVKAAKTVGTRTSGYTRIVKLAPRKSDASPMAIIQIISETK